MAGSPNAVWINGRPPAGDTAIGHDDRGLAYGDGLFETMVLRDGAVRFLQSHLQRLRSSCERLDIQYPGDAELEADLSGVAGSQRAGVIKIIVTRGVGARGYRPTAGLSSTRIVSLHPLPDTSSVELAVRWCETALSRNPVLAGMKHLNRLENVLAQREWNDAAIGEGLMLDTEGELVSATAGNVFIGRNETLLTPDLRYCGVRGVMRGEVLRVAAELGIAVSEEPLWPRDIEESSEVFITNAVRGIRPVVALDSMQWAPGPLARKLAAALAA